MVNNFKLTSLLIILGISIMAAGCDDSSSADGPDQVYEVELSALNDSNADIATVDGTAELTVDGDQLTVTVNANGVAPNVLHPQHIHASGTCPTASADTNDDGFVDVIEGVPSYGEIFIPLDNELANLDAQTSFPMPENDEIDYMQSVSINELEAEAGEDINLDGRHIVIHGVSADVDLPESVQTLGDTPARLTLPVACGTITQVESN